MRVLVRLLNTLAMVCALCCAAAVSTTLVTHGSPYLGSLLGLAALVIVGFVTVAAFITREGAEDG